MPMTATIWSLTTTRKWDRLRRENASSPLLRNECIASTMREHDAVGD